MFLDSEIDIKLTNSAKLLSCKNKVTEMYLSSNNNPQNKKPKIINIKKLKEIKISNIQNMLYKNNMHFFEKYAKIYFNNKYSNDPNFYYIKVINDIISNESTHVVAEFKDYLIYGDDSEFLHDIYDLYESKKYLPKLIDYYMKCSVIFPNYVVFPENKYIFKNIQRKQKLIDFQQEQENKKEQILKGEIDFDDNDDLFSTRTFYTILNQTNTSHIKRLLFGMNKKSKKELEDFSLKKIIGVINDEEKKNKRKKKIISKIIKRQKLNIKSDIKLKFKSKIINNINLKINIKGRNYNIKDEVSNCNKNKMIFHTNTNNNVKNFTINNVKKTSKNIKFISNPKTKALKNNKLNNYMNYKNLNTNKINNKNCIYSLINDSKLNHISTKKNSNGKKTGRKKNKNQNNIYNKSNNNSSGKSKKTIHEYFKRKISPKAIIIKMLTEHINKINKISPNSKSKKNKNKKEKDNCIIKKKPVSLTPSITNMKMASHKTKKIYNRNDILKNNSTSIINIKHKNKILENNNKNDRKCKSIKIKDTNNNNSNYNIELINFKNNNNFNNINSNNIINNNLIKETPMNLYKVNSFRNIKKIKDIKNNSKIKYNKHNSTLTGTTTCSYMKHSSIYYDKKTSKPINKNFYKNEILINGPNNKRINKQKHHNIILNHFSINSSNSNINLNSNKVNIKTENIYSKQLSKNILSPSQSLGYITNNKNYLYEKKLKKYSGIFPIRKAYFNIKINGSPFTSRMLHDTSRTRIMKSTINNEKRSSKYEKNNLKNINNSLNLKSVKNIKTQRNNSNNKREYLVTYYGCFKPKK